jgi:hypothetical protein
MLRVHTNKHSIADLRRYNSDDTCLDTGQTKETCIDVNLPNQCSKLIGWQQIKTMLVVRQLWNKLTKGPPKT